MEADLDDDRVETEIDLLDIGATLLSRLLGR